MRNICYAFITILLVASTAFAADDQKKQEDRLENAGQVMSEILNMPDSIPHDLLDRTKCVVVIPSVLKAAFVVGGSYGRGAMVCRSGQDFTGPWGAPASPAASGPLGMIEIHRLGISSVSVIEEGTDSKTLLLAVGHMSRTALPGADGNVVLTAHRDTFFRKLGELQPGDMINIASVENSYRYRVESMSVVSPSDVYVTKASTGKTLTLITCFPFHYIGPAPMRFVVRAVMQP